MDGEVIENDTKTIVSRRKRCFQIYLYYFTEAWPNSEAQLVDYQLEFHKTECSELKKLTFRALGRRQSKVENCGSRVFICWGMKSCYWSNHSNEGCINKVIPWREGRGGEASCLFLKIIFV